MLPLTHVKPMDLFQTDAHSISQGSATSNIYPDIYPVLHTRPHRHWGLSSVALIIASPTQRACGCLGFAAVLQFGNFLYCFYFKSAVKQESVMNL